MKWQNILEMFKNIAALNLAGNKDDTWSIIKIKKWEKSENMFIDMGWWYCWLGLCYYFIKLHYCPAQRETSGHPIYLPHLIATVFPKLESPESWTNFVNAEPRKRLSMYALLTSSTLLVMMQKSEH